MAAPKNSQGIVSHCVKRQDGSFMVVTRNRLSGSSPVEVPVGQIITIRDGIVEARR